MDVKIWKENQEYSIQHNIVFHFIVLFELGKKYSAFKQLKIFPSLSTLSLIPTLSQSVLLGYNLKHTAS